MQTRYYLIKIKKQYKNILFRYNVKDILGVYTYNSTIEPKKI